MNTPTQPQYGDALRILQMPHAAGRHLLLTTIGRLASFTDACAFIATSQILSLNKFPQPTKFCFETEQDHPRQQSIARISHDLDHSLGAVRLNLRRSLAKCQMRKVGAIANSGSMGTMTTGQSGERELTDDRNLTSSIQPDNSQQLFGAQFFPLNQMMQLAASTNDVQSLQTMLQSLMMFLSGQAGNESFSKPPRSPPNPDPESVQAFGKLVYEKCTDQLLIKRNHKQELGPTFSNSGNDCDTQPINFLNGSDYGPLELLSLSKASREDSIRVQEYLKSLDPVNLDLVAYFLSLHLEDLITDKFGNYVVQLLVNIHSETLKAVIELGISKFKEIAVNEYGSRLFQVVCALSDEFNQKALKLFEFNFDELITNIAGSILLSRLIATASSELNYRFAIRKLEKNKSYLQKGYYNRMLATLVGACSDAMVSEVVGLIKNNIWVLMNDKFGNYVLQVLFTRQHYQAISLCKTACLRNANNILFRKYPKYILMKIYELGTYSSFIQELVTAILKSSDIIYQDLASKSEAFHLFLLLLGSMKPQPVLDALDKLETALQKCHKSLKYAKSQDFFGMIRQFRKAAKMEQDQHHPKDSAKGNTDLSSQYTKY